MADDIAYEIVEGSGGRKTRRGWILDRIATVYNIDITVPASAVILYAVDVLENDGVVIGSVHPSRAGLYLTDFELAGLSTDGVKVRLIYKDFPFADTNIRIGATVNQVVTNRGFLVNEGTDRPAATLSDMHVKYTFPAERELRRLAGTLRTSLHAVNWYEFLLRLGLVPPKQDVIEVSKNLVGLANCLTESKYNDANIRRDQTIRKLLGFPDTD